MVHTLVLGGISQCPSYLSGLNKESVQAEYRKQIDVFVQENMDFLLCEVYKDIDSRVNKEELSFHYIST